MRAHCVWDRIASAIFFETTCSSPSSAVDPARTRFHDDVAWGRWSVMSSRLAFPGPRSRRGCHNRSRPLFHRCLTPSSLVCAAVRTATRIAPPTPKKPRMAHDSDKHDHDSDKHDHDSDKHDHDSDKHDHDSDKHGPCEIPSKLAPPTCRFRSVNRSG